MKNDFTLPTLDALMKQIAKDIVAAFEGGELPGVYALAQRLAPSLYPGPGSAADRGRCVSAASDLLSDAILLIGKRRRR